MELDVIECGDAYELIKKLPDHSIDLIVTDPPYQYDSSKWFTGGFENAQEKAHYKNISERIEEDNLKKGIKAEMLDEWCRVLKKINLFIFCNKNQIISYLDYFVTKKKCNWEMLIWNKTNPVPLANNAFIHDKEYCLRFQEKGATQNTYDYEKRKTVYNLPLNQKDGRNFKHPTTKPLAMVRNLIEIGSDRGGYCARYVLRERNDGCGVSRTGKALHRLRTQSQVGASGKGALKRDSPNRQIPSGGLRTGVLAMIEMLETLSDLEKAKNDLDYFRHVGGFGYKQAKARYQRLLKKAKKGNYL